eukprot:TRINITY_DN1604_c1_g1::TRINITY_DN1604_c1_g1_i1::g.17901::m.17901 TRINITY_DN1604_c1_g1::TRINITY_DN1604_c1_g1_i1::g.17901  ORF type:complete len:188 (+),score=13.23,DUF3592/PF12158.3/1.1e-07 TRINITY_DN1604_c1_g1_i1:39-566(+)
MSSLPCLRRLVCSRLSSPPSRSFFNAMKASDTEYQLRKKLFLIRLKYARARLAFFGLFVGIAFESSRYVYKGYISEQWKTTYGEVLEVEAARFLNFFEYTKIKYDYEVEGKRYIGDRINFGEAAIHYFHMFRTGDPVNVYYDPKKPSDCVLQPGLRSAPSAFLFCSLFSVIALKP